MPYNVQELLALPAEERLALAEQLWESLEEELMEVTDDDISFARERLKMHRENPDDGVSIEVFRKYFSDKYGF